LLALSLPQPTAHLLEKPTTKNQPKTNKTGCGKSTFMRRMTSIFGGTPKPPAGGNPDSNTLISDMTTVICLDDYHSLDRKGRSAAGVTALAPEAQNFELMYQQVSPWR
jgi:phosphoribulokinase